MFGKKQPTPEELDALPAFLVARRLEDGRNVVQLDPESFPNAFSVGIFLVDIARHYARAMAAADPQHIDVDDCLNAILDGFVAEVDNPTDMGSGSITRVQ